MPNCIECNGEKDMIDFSFYDDVCDSCAEEQCAICGHILDDPRDEVCWRCEQDDELMDAHYGGND
jgi:hypothetical protein